MKLFKKKMSPQPSNRFERYLQNQPVFNWFDRYKDNKQDTPIQGNTELLYSNWMAKQVNQ
ncbi:hypothetical protein [Alteromonas sp. ASW11-130]|uniref:hypothetical protein n=1 Tax=Alteromonas sp. ASW11-130 TaxID=3015775 RepID=UPI002242A93D|nr:hypothetical protein [Alteromonas sp. ASW11-130]MCW8090294.1 DUF1987 domain-containing protein [Alteromonas sp. ASW11-130]